MQDELRKKWHNAMDWELSSVRIHGWIKKKVRWITHRMYVMCVYMYMYAWTLCVSANVRIYTYICINNTHQTCMRTQNTYINTQYRYAWKRSDTRETRMRTNHVTSRACQVLMRIRAAPITRATTTKRTRAFFVSIFRSLWCSLTYRDLTTRKNAYIVFQHEGKTYIPIAMFTRPSSSLRE